MVLLDNFEDVLSIETGRINDTELDEALRSILEAPPHGLKIIITTSVPPAELLLVQPSLQQRLDLDEGLKSPYAENILKKMDEDGKVGLRDASEALLADAGYCTRGFPKALEYLFGILSADRDASLPEIMDRTRDILPDRVVTVLVGEAYSRLDPAAQRVMQALAILRFQVQPAAVDFLLQPWVLGIDSKPVLKRLVNMKFVFVSRDSGKYYLDEGDRHYVLSRIPEGDSRGAMAESGPMTRLVLLRRASEWFRLSRKPRDYWDTLADIRGATL